MFDNGYRGFVRGIKGSTAEHLENLGYKIKKDKERLKEISNKIEEKETTFDNIMKFNKQIKGVSDLEKHKRFSKKIELEPQDYEDLFMQEQLAKSTQDELKHISKSKRELEKAKNRIIDIDNLFMHIYEDNISGKLTDERFRKLSFNYDKEQQELKLKIEQLSKEIDNTEKKTTYLTQFISNVKKYTEITELTP